jgi:two-component system response regulator FixJ
MALAKSSIPADRPDAADAAIVRLGCDGKPKIAVVDDEESVRRSMACLLESEGYSPLSFASGDEFLRSGPPGDLTCILLDICMPGRSGLEVLRELAWHGSTVPVLVVTGQADISRAVEAMKLHAFDLIEKPCAPADVLGAVARAEAVARDSKAARDASREAAALVARLTDRQQQVLCGIVRGDANKIIAWKLGLSVRTVEAYRAQLLERLRVRSSIEAVRIAMAAGMDGS